VTTGRGLADREVEHVAQALADLRSESISTCASLGILDGETLSRLKASGVTRYHHNLETSRSHFPSVCTTHTYEERIQTLKEARKAGLSLCCGGVFGIGETDEQVLELALALKELDVEAVPLNFLVPIQGTPLAESKGPSALRCLKIIALFRFVLPDKEILICGGREANLKDSHPLIFRAGANGIMTGNYLTTEGRQLRDDLSLLDRLGLVPRPKP
jgi:biotin synthase